MNIAELRRLEAEATLEKASLRLRQSGLYTDADLANHLDTMHNALTELLKALEEARAERDLLQNILDARPAINANLPESYVRWSQSLYSGELTRASLNIMGRNPLPPYGGVDVG